MKSRHVTTCSGQLGYYILVLVMVNERAPDTVPRRRAKDTLMPGPPSLTTMLFS